MLTRFAPSPPACCTPAMPSRRCARGSLSIPVTQSTSSPGSTEAAVRLAEQEAEAIEDDGGGAAFMREDAEPEGDLGNDANKHHAGDHAEGDDDVLPHDADGAPAEVPGIQEGIEAVAGEDEVGLLAGGVAAAEAHGDADIGGG